MSDTQELEITIKAFKDMAYNQSNPDKAQNRMLVANWLTELKQSRQQNVALRELLREHVVDTKHDADIDITMFKCRECRLEWLKDRPERHTNDCRYARLMGGVETNG